MFEKPSPPKELLRVGTPNGPPRGSRLIAGPPTILGPDLRFEGRISGDGELQVDGTFKGEIEVAKLVISANGAVEGNIQGGEVEVRGRVVGNIDAQSVKLLSTAHVDGDITHAQLAVEVGAYFQGRCQQERPAAALKLVPGANGTPPQEHEAEISPN